MGATTLMVESKAFDQSDSFDSTFQQMEQGTAAVDAAAQHEHFVVSSAQRRLLLAVGAEVPLTHLSAEPSLISTDPGTR
mgnify:FL=1|jgi:hypothetical protein